VAGDECEPSVVAGVGEDSEMDQINDEVYSVRLPVNRPFTGKYAVFQPTGEKQFPNFEDHILIARNLDGDFQPVFSAFVPFDEEPFRLWDTVTNPENLVLYQRFYLAFSTDGGKTIRKLRPNQYELIGVDNGRWSSVGIREAFLHRGKLIIRTHRTGWNIPDNPSPRRVEVGTWEIPLGEGSEPIFAGQEVLGQGIASDSNCDFDNQALLKTDRTRLFARSTSKEPFRHVPLTDFAEKLAKLGRVDFFGGSQARGIY